MKFNSNQVDVQIDLLASFFGDHFAKQLYNLHNEKSYSVYMACFTEVFHWAHEFYIQYYFKQSNWEAFKEGRDNIFQAATREEFQIAWGNERLNQFVVLHIEKSGNKFSHRDIVSENFETAYKNLEMIKK